MKKIRAHFDGHAIIPDEPVELPVDQPLEVMLEISLRASTPGRATHHQDGAAERLRRLARATGCIAGPTIPRDALRRESLYDEQP
jgi:hypothetical protein